MLIILFLICSLLGLIVGFLSGLLGIGGGLLIVPTLKFLLPYTHIPEQLVMPMALATSLCCIIFTSGKSSYHHFKYGNLHLPLLSLLVPCVALGGGVGGQILLSLTPKLQTLFFATILIFVAISMLKQKSKLTLPVQPAKIEIGCVGFLIGIMASLAGIGGAALLIPYLIRSQFSMLTAVSTACCCSIISAISALISLHWHQHTLPDSLDYSLGYIFLPALVAICMTSMYTSRIGVDIAQNIATLHLKRIFAFFLLGLSAILLLSIKTQ